MKSPDGNLEIRFELTDGGAPLYSLDYKGKSTILPSGLGFEFRGEKPQLVFGAEIEKGKDGTPVQFHEGFVMEKAERGTFDETWEPVWGEESEIRNHYNELAVTLRQTASDRVMTIRFRLYNDGLGFRYEFPEQKNLQYFVITKELTQFAMAGDHKAFWIPGDYDTQEYDYVESRLSEIRGLMQNAITPNSSRTVYQYPRSGS